MAASHRIRQGMRMLLAFAHVIDYDLAAPFLTSQQLAIFKRMSRAEQLHSLNVLRSVMAQQDETPRDLAAAALLHDVGKSKHPLAIWQKSLAVIGRKLAPRLYRRWSQVENPNWWQRAFVVAVHHPAWSAEMLREAGTNERTLWLIRHHADDLSQWRGHPYCDLLRRLQQADDVN